MNNSLIYFTALLLGVVYLSLQRYRTSVNTSLSPDQRILEQNVLKELYKEYPGDAEAAESLPNDNSLNNLRQDVNKTLIGYVYKGIWLNNNQNDLFDYLTERSGEMYLLFFHKKERSGLQNLYLEIVFLNPKYSDQKLINGYFAGLQNYYENETQQFTGNLTFTYIKQNKGRQKGSEVKSSSKFLIQISKNGDVTAPISSHKDIQIVIKMTSLTGHKYDFTSTLYFDTFNQTLQNIYYCLYNSLLSAIQIFSLVKLIQYFQESDAEANKLSLMTVCFSASYDEYLCVTQLYQAFQQNDSFQYFIIPTILYFIQSTIFEMRLILIIWKVRYSGEFQTLAQLRKALATFHLKFYLTLVLFFTLFYFFYLYDWFDIICGLFIMPQIVHNAMRGNDSKFYPYYVFGLLFIKLGLPLYIKGCPNNIGGVQPSYTVCITLSIIIVIQILFLYLQHLLKPRFFIPSMFIPGSFSYAKTYVYDEAKNEEPEMCAICMFPLHEDPNQLSPEQPALPQAEINVRNQEQNPSKEGEDSLDVNLLGEDQHNEAEQAMNINLSHSNINEKIESQAITESQSAKKKVFKKKIYETPCHHRYHEDCLQSWMEYKLECPNCRAKLPAL